MRKTRRVISLLLAVVLIGALIPFGALKAQAGIDPGTFGVVNEGETGTVLCYGNGLYDYTNLTLTAPDNTVAKLTITKSSSEDPQTVYIEGSYSEIFYYLKGGAMFLIEVISGRVTVGGNYTSYKAPTVSSIRNNRENDWRVIPNIKQVYLSGGDTAELFISDLPKSPNEYYVSQASDYNSGSYRGGYYSEDPKVASVDENGVITARDTGTTTIHMAYRFGFTASTNALFTISCKVQVVGDYGLGFAYANYYAEGNDKYFRIVDLADPKANGFDVEIGENTYNTGDGSELMVTFPDDYKGRVKISKEGYLTQSLDEEHYGSYNFVTLHKSSEAKPIIYSVLGRSANTDQWMNLKIQSLNVCKGIMEEHIIDVGVHWGALVPGEVWIENGTHKIPVVLGSTGSILLGEMLSDEGLPTYVCARSADGTVSRSQILINVSQPQKHINADFGSDINASYTGPQDGLNQLPFKIKLGGNLSFEYEIDAEGNVKGTIGVKLAGISGSNTGNAPYYQLIKETVNRVKNMDNTQARENEAQELFNALERGNADIEEGISQFAFDAHVALVGYAEGKLVNGKLQIDEVGALCRVSVEASLRRQSLSFVVPHYWEFQIKCELELPIIGATQSGSGKLQFTMPDFTVTVTFSAGVHLGLVQTKELMDFGVVLEAALKINVPMEGGFAESTGIINSKIYVVASLAGFEINAGHFDVVEDLYLWGEDNARSRNRQMANIITNEASYTRLHRNLSGGVTLLSQAQEGGVQLLASDVYQEAMPRLVKFGDKELMVWLADKPDRSDENRSCLYYAVYDPADGSWTEPVAVLDNGTADQSPVLTEVDGRICLVWSKADRLYESGASMTETVGALDLYFTEFDPDSCTFYEPECISGANGVYDADPMILELDNELCVVWRQNSANDIFGMEGTNSIYCAMQRDEFWYAEPVAEDLGFLNGFTAAVTDMGLRVVYAADTDGDYETANDIELFSAEQGQITRLTDNDTSDYDPFFDGETLCSYRDGALICGEELIPLPENATDVTLLRSGHRRAVLYRVLEEHLSTNLYAMMDHGEGWSQPVKLTDLEKRYILSYIPRWEQDALVITAAARQIGEDGAPAQTDIIRCTKSTAPELTLTDGAINPYSITKNGMLAGTVTVKNTGLTPLETLTVHVTDPAGQPLSAGDYCTPLLPGQEQTLDFLCAMEDLTEYRFSVHVVGEDSNETPVLSTTRELSFLPRDISVENPMAWMDENGNTTVTVFVVNRGMMEAGDVQLVLRRGSENGDVLATRFLTAPEPGCSSVVELTTDVPEAGETVFVCAALGQEEHLYANNAAFTLVQQPQYTQLEADTMEGHSPLVPGPLETDREYLMTEDTYCTFTPEETGYYQLTFRIHSSSYWSLDGAVRPDLRDGSWNEIPCLLNDREDVEINEGYCCLERYIYHLQAGKTYDVDLDLYSNAYAVVSLTKAEQVPPTAITLSQTDVTLTLLDPDQSSLYLEATFSPEGSFGVLDWQSSDESVVAVDDSGWITARGEGTATVTVTSGEISAQCTVTVVKPEATPLETERYYGSLDAGYYICTPEQGGFYTIDAGEDLSLYDHQGQYLTCVNGYEEIYYLEAGRPVFVEISYGWGSTDLMISRLPELTPGQETTVDLTVSYNQKYFNLTATEDWMYAISSQGDLDTIGWICDGVDRIGYNDDGGEGSNFSLRQFIPAGEFYLLGVRLYSDEGSFTVTMEKQDYLTSMEILSMPDQTQYIRGYTEQHFDQEGLILRFTRSDGTSFDWDPYWDGSYPENTEAIRFNTDTLYENGQVLITYGHLSTVLQLTLKENPVKAIHLEQGTDYEYIENLEGYETSREDPETGEDIPFFYYYAYNSHHKNVRIRIEYHDGTSKIAAIGETVEGCDVEWEDGQWDHPWSLGSNNQSTVSYLGHHCNLPITVIENPVERIEVEHCTPIRLPEYAYGYWTDWYNPDTGEYEDYFEYDVVLPEDLVLRVWYTDGTSETLDDVYPEYSVAWEAPWVVGGEYSLTLTYMGRETSLPITVIKNPLERLELAGTPTQTFEYGDLSRGTMSAWSYWLDLDRADIKLKAVYTDGTSKTFTADGETPDGYPLEIEYQEYYEEPTTDTVTLTYLGKEVSYDITLVPSPVQSLEVLQAPNRTRYPWYASPLMEGIKVKILYENGKQTVVTATAENLNFNGSDYQVMADGFPMLLGSDNGYEDCFSYVIYRGVMLDISDLFTFEDNEVADIAVEQFSPDGDGMEITVRYGDGSEKLLHYRSVSWHEEYGYGYALTEEGIVYYSIWPIYDGDRLTGYNLNTLSRIVEIPAGGVTLSGQVTAANSEPETVELWAGDTLQASCTAANGSYTLTGIAPGTYTLKVSKPDHVTRSYEVTVGTEDRTMDVKLCLIGDVTGDGRVNIMDVAKLYAHVKVGALTDPYALACSDTTGDGRVNIMDVARLYAHVKGMSQLF